MKRLMVSVGILIGATAAHADPADPAVRNAPMCRHAFEYAGAKELRPVGIRGNETTTQLVLAVRLGAELPAVFGVDEAGKTSAAKAYIHEAGERAGDVSMRGETWTYTVQPPIKEAVIRWRNLSTRIAIDSTCMRD